MSAYFVYHGKIHDPDKIGDYVPLAMASMEGFDVEVLAVDDTASLVEGDVDQPRAVILKFASQAELQRWYNSDAYQKALPQRLAGAEGVAFAVSGVDA